MRSLRLFPLLLLSVAVQACVPKAVIWDEAVQRLPGALADTMRLACCTTVNGDIEVETGPEINLFGENFFS